MGDSKYIQQLEAEIKQLREALEHASLNQDETKLQAVREFLGNLSHDVRTPLTSLENSVYLLHRLTDEAKRERYLNVIQMQVHHLQRLFFDIYSAARLDMQVTAYEFKRVYVSSMLKIVLAQHESVAQERNHSLTSDIADDLPRILADEVKLSHALARIVENAIMYTPEGGAVHVRAYMKANQLMIEVEDNGIGISEPALPRIFDAFFREDEARNLQTGRTGLGLTIASKVIKHHAGGIEVYSEQGKGSLFRVCLNPLQMN